MSGAVGSLWAGLGLSRRTGAKAAKRSRPIEYSLLLTATMCLLAFGVVMVFSASSSFSLLGETGDGAYFLKRTLMFGVIGLLALRVAATLGLDRIRRLTPAILLGAVVLLIMTKLIGVSANGAQRWIALGPIQVQPSEITKVALMLYGASLLAARPRMTRDLRGMSPVLLVAAGCVGLIVAEPDLGTGMVTAFSVAALLIAAGAKLRHLAMIAGALLLLVVVAVLIEPYRQERLLNFFNPTADASGSGFQGMQASIALGSGGLFGVGLGESVQKAFYLPEAHTDMIAAVIGEELGLLGISIVVGLYMMLGYAGFRTAQRARDRYGRLLAAGLTAMIMVQASINLFAVLGLAPLTGVTLPFVSYGNSSLIVTLAAVGLLLNVAAGGTGGAVKARAPRSARPSAGGLRLLNGGRSEPARRRRTGGARAASRDRSGGNRGTRGAGARRRRRA